MIPARCERSREWASLRLDGMLSSFESALLDRHLRRCASCHAFAAAAARQTQLVRSAALEPLPRPVELPERAPRRRTAARSGVLTAAGAALAAVAAAVAVTNPLSLFGGGQTVAASTRAVAKAPPGRQLVVLGEQSGPSQTSVEVPRIKVEPASFADGPVHGLYSLPA